jgi:hypothetical protein
VSLEDVNRETTKKIFAAEERRGDTPADHLLYVKEINNLGR